MTVSIFLSRNSFQVEEAICKLGDENGRRKVYVHCYLLLLLFVILVLMLLVVKCKIYFIDILIFRQMPFCMQGGGGGQVERESRRN